jgi:hypothetical protein
MDELNGEKEPETLKNKLSTQVALAVLHRAWYCQVF